MAMVLLDRGSIAARVVYGNVDGIDNKQKGYRDVMGGKGYEEEEGEVVALLKPVW